MQPTSFVPNVGLSRQSAAAPLLLQGNRGTEPAQMLTRGPLAARAHRLLGLGAVGSAQLGSRLPAMVNAFGGDAATYHRTANPWTAARSLARPIETLASQSSVSWLLSR